jgi:hypothetical protein
MSRAARLAAASLFLAGTAGAQSVLVRAVESGTNRPIGGAIVSLVDSTDRRLAQGLTNESGRLMLRAPTQGSFKLRADRIGHPGIWSDFFTLRDTLSIALAMPAERVNLPDLTVRGSTACQRRADSEETAALWEEIRKALAAGQITSATERVELAVRRFRRYRTLSGGLRADSTVREHRTRASPFVSPPAATLGREGYIRDPGGGFQFHGPDAITLQSPEFLENHCFELVRPKKDAEGLVGLGFRPTKEVKRPDIRGTLWVDRATAELKYLEFEFVNVPEPVRAPGIGGRVEFERLEEGAWIIRDWYIRAPQRVALQGRGARRTDASLRDTVVGYVDEGGLARPAGDVTVALGEAAAAVREGSTTVAGDVRGRVVSPEGQPIAGAQVAVAESDSLYTTNGEGRFEVTQLPAGRLSVRIRAIGFRPFGAILTLPSGKRLLDTTLVLARAAQVLDSVVVEGKTDRFEAGKMIDVERREKMGFGKFLKATELHDPLRGNLDMQLRRFAKMRMAPLCGGRGYGAAAGLREPPPIRVRCEDSSTLLDCFMAVYLDGALHWSPDMGNIVQPPDLSKFSVMDLQAVEVYRSPAELPIEFAGPMSGCGVVLLWTR